MSLLNIQILDDKAYVAVDTAGPDGCAVSKLSILPHAHLVFAARGVLFMTSVIATMWSSRQHDVDFDLVAEQTPGMLDEVLDGVRAQREQAGEDVSVIVDQHQEVAIVGWSKNEGRMAGVLMTRLAGSNRFETRPITSHLSEMDEDLTDLVVPGYKEYMVTVARAQLRCIRRKYPEAVASTGRSLLLAEVTRRSVTVSDIANLDAE